MPRRRHLLLVGLDLLGPQLDLLHPRVDPLEPALHLGQLVAALVDVRPLGHEPLTLGGGHLGGLLGTGALLLDIGQLGLARPDLLGAQLDRRLACSHLLGGGRLAGRHLSLGGGHRGGGLLDLDQLGVDLGERLLALGESRDPLVGLGVAALGLGMHRGHALLGLLEHRGALLEPGFGLAQPGLGGCQLVQRPGQVGLLGGDRLELRRRLGGERGCGRLALGGGRELLLEALLGGLELLGALHHVHAHRVDGELLLRQHLLDLLRAMLTVVELGLAGVQAPLLLGQLGRSEGAALAQLLDEAVALAFDLLALALLVLDLLLERRGGLLELSDAGRDRGVDIHLGRRRIPVGGLRLALGERLLARLEVCSAAVEVGLELREVSAIGVAPAVCMRRGDALVHGECRLALGELALAPGEARLALGEDDLRLLLERRLLALEPLLGLAQRGEAILHRAAEPAWGVFASGRPAVVTHVLVPLLGGVRGRG